jgi:hypothetical protein
MKGRVVPRRRYGTALAILIAAVSVLGALAAWRASESSIRAADLDEDAMLERAQRLQRIAFLERSVEEDLHLFNLYQTHLRSYRLLSRDAQQARLRAPDQAADLLLLAQGELELARSLLPFFQVDAPAYSGSERLEYDQPDVLSHALAEDLELGQLRPETTFRRAREEHRRSVALVLTVMLFVTALFFLTVAQFSDSAWLRPVLGIAGVAIAAGSIVYFISKGFVGWTI